MAKKRKSPSPRQRKLLKNLAKGMRPGQAALDAGYTPNAPDQAAYQAIKGLEKTMPELLDAYGLTDAALIHKYLVPGLNATETEFAKFEGSITDEREVVAWGPRKEFLDMTFRLKGSYAPVKQAVDASGAQLAVQIITNVQMPHA